MTDREGKIAEYIGKQLVRDGTVDVATHQALLEDGIIDSFSLQQLLTWLEQEFDIVIADEYLQPDNFRSVSAIAAVVRELDQS